MRKPVRKAVIPAAGLGTRFLPATKAQPKEMLPVYDKPTIQYVIEESVNSGVDDILIVTGKGNKERQVYLNTACKKAIARYFRDRNQRTYAHKDRQALFLSRTGSRLTPRRVEQIVNGYLEKAGLSGQGYTVHKLRHSAATLMYRYGDVDILTLKEILGHAHTSTTEIYTHLDDKRLKEAADASPLSELEYQNKKKGAD